MSNNKPIRRIAIIGTGVIGASWTSLFLAKGLEVIATDIAPDAEPSLRRFVKAAWPALERLGLAPGASQTRLDVHGRYADGSSNRRLHPGERTGADRFQEEALSAAGRVIVSRSDHCFKLLGVDDERDLIGLRTASRTLRHRSSFQSAASGPAR